MSVTSLAERRQQQVIDPAVVEQVLIKGDLRQLTPTQKLAYYKAVCESVGLNPLTQPFQYIVLNGRETLYARKDCTDQLRMIHDVSIDPKAFAREVIEGCYVVTAPATLPSGRTDVSTGVVPIEGLKGEARANAMMKAETKAKRRVTLSICGLGMLDETEADSIPDAHVTTAPATPPPDPPTGYTEWKDKLMAVAYSGEGLKALETVWRDPEVSSREHREYLRKYELTQWESLKTAAIDNANAREPGEDD